MEAEPFTTSNGIEMDKPIRYKLDVNLAIVKEEWNGPLPQKKDDDNRGYWGNSFANERLSINETLMLGTMDFMGLMKVLGEMHAAILSVKPEDKES